MNAQEAMRYHIKNIQQEIKLNQRALTTKELIQQAENRKEFEMLDRFEKWSNFLTDAQEKIDEVSE